MNAAVAELHSISVLETIGGSLRILVADDDAPLRQIVVTTLIRAGHQVVEASDGAEAWDRFQEQPFPMVVTDLQMPVLGGLELLKRVKAASPDTEVVIITGYGDVGVVIEALRAGAANFVEKPFIPSEFIAQIGPCFTRCGLRAEAACLQVELKSERKRREVDVRMATLGRLLSGLAHEVHNPLTFVKGNIELLQRFLEDSEAKDVSPPIEHMKTLLNDLAYGVGRIEGLMDSMRRFGTSRPSEQDEMPLKTVLDNAIRLAASRKPSHASLHTELPGEEVRIVATAVEMESCFTNLLVNAYDAVGVTGSRVDLRVRLFPYETGGIAGFAEVTVCDDGPGIPAGILDEVFTPFFSRKEGGTGLGLGIAYESAKRNGAQVTLESEEDQGATVVVRMPYSVAECAPPTGETDR